MKVHTKTAHFNVSPEKLYAFISNIENLPKWATGYVLDLKKVGNDYKITTPAGELFEILDANAEQLTVDMYCGPTKEELWCWPARVMSDNMGGSIFAFTCIKMPDQDDNEFSAQLCELDKEFENIRKLVA